MALQAYYNFKAAHPDQVRNPYFYFVDYGLSKRTPRGYVFDMDQKKLVEGPFIVAAGRGSSENAKGVPTRFSNGSGSGTTSLGLYVTKGTYAFTGHSGGSLYSSIGLRLERCVGSVQRPGACSWRGRARRAVRDGVGFGTQPGLSGNGAGARTSPDSEDRERWSGVSLLAQRCAVDAQRSLGERVTHVTLHSFTARVYRGS